MSNRPPPKLDRAISSFRQVAVGNGSVVPVPQKPKRLSINPTWIKYFKMFNVLVATAGLAATILAFIFWDTATCTPHISYTIPSLGLTTFVTSAVGVWVPHSAKVLVVNFYLFMQSGYTIGNAVVAALAYNLDRADVKSKAQSKYDPNNSEHRAVWGSVDGLTDSAISHANVLGLCGAVLSVLLALTVLWGFVIRGQFGDIESAHAKREKAAQAAREKEKQAELVAHTTFVLADGHSPKITPAPTQGPARSALVSPAERGAAAAAAAATHSEDGPRKKSKRHASHNLEKSDGAPSSSSATPSVAVIHAPSSSAPTTAASSPMLDGTASTRKQKKKKHRAHALSDGSTSGADNTSAYPGEARLIVLSDPASLALDQPSSLQLAQPQPFAPASQTQQLIMLPVMPTNVPTLFSQPPSSDLTTLASMVITSSASGSTSNSNSHGGSSSRPGTHGSNSSRPGTHGSHPPSSHSRRKSPAGPTLRSTRIDL